MKASRKSIAVKAALGAYLRPLIAQDAAIGDLGALVRGVKAATIAQDKARIVKDVQSAVAGKLAQDVELDTTELAEIIEAAAAAEPEEVAEDEDEDKQREGESDADYKARMEAKKAPKAAQDEGDGKKDGDKPTVAAMDAAIKDAVERTEAATVARMNAIRQAEKEVAPLIGEVMAQDSAEAVYKLALDHAGVDTKGVHPSAYSALVRMLNTAKTQRPTTSALAMDSSANDSFAERYPTAGKLIRS